MSEYTKPQTACAAESAYYIKLESGDYELRLLYNGSFSIEKAGRLIVKPIATLFEALWEAAPTPPALEPTESYVQQVPDKCDRITWRGRYHHLPLQLVPKQPAPEAISMEPKPITIDVEPDAWASKVGCVGPDYGKIRYDKLPIQSLNPAYYTHEKLYAEKSVIGLMKAAYYDGYTDREAEARQQLAHLQAEVERLRGERDGLLAGLNEVVTYMGPSTPECCGCEYEWVHALKSAKEAIAKITESEKANPLIAEAYNCPFCNEKFLLGQPTVISRNGCKMHLDCAAADEDDAHFDNDMGFGS